MPDEIQVRTITNAYDAASHYGLFGSILEKMPLELSYRLQRSNAKRSAEACLVAAITGRILLTPLRIASSVFVLVNATVMSSLYFLMHLELKAAMLALLFAVTLCEPLTGPAPNLKASLFEMAHILDAQTIWDLNVDHRTVVDLITPMARDENNASERVKMFVNHAIKRFNVNLEEGLSENEGHQAADSIAEELVVFCKNMPDDKMLVFGLRILQDFMDITYDDCDWTRLPDQDAIKLIHRAMAPLRTTRVADELACQVADATRDHLVKRFEEERSERPVKDGMRCLAQFMAEFYPEAGWQPPAPDVSVAA